MNFLAYLCAILKDVIYGLSVFFTGGLTNSVDVMDVLALRFLLSFFVFWLLKMFRVIKVNVHIKDLFTKGERRVPMVSLILTAFFEPVLYMFFETVGIANSSDIMTAVILSLLPIASCIVEMIVLKERSTFMQKFLLVLGIVGVVYISVKSSGAGGNNDSIIGIICLFLAVVSGALYLAFSRKSTRSFSSIEITYMYSALGALAFNAINVVRHLINGDILHYFDPYLSLDNMIGFIFLGVVSAVAATGINNYCLGRMQASTMSAFGGLSTVVTILIGVFVGGETLYYYHYIGIALIFTRMIGVSYIAISRTKRTLTIPRELTRTLVCQKTAQKNHTLARMRSD
jgi:drug/metabolite transporter (DMT)-like permease